MFRKKGQASYTVVRVIPIPINVSDTEYERALKASGLVSLMEMLYPTVSSQQN